jgi:serpin B
MTNDRFKPSLSGLQPPFALKQLAAATWLVAASLSCLAQTAMPTPASAAAPAQTQAVPVDPKKATEPTLTPATKDDKKTIVLDQRPVPPPPAPRQPDATEQDSTTISAALADLALDLMQGQSAGTGNAQVNSVVSSVSVASALGMVHAGTSDAGAREIGALLLGTTPRLQKRAFTSELPNLLSRLSQTGSRTGAVIMANRVWMDQGVVPSVPPSYAATVAKRFKADGAVLQFSKAADARQAINAWVSDKTGKRIPDLMPEGSITPNTKLVVTNAIYFKSPWEKPFDAAQTVAKPFFTDRDTSKPVPTMVDERSVRTGLVRNVTVFEVPFVGKEFSLLVGMPPVGHTLDAFEKDLEGPTLTKWSAPLKATTCSFELPKFTIAPASKPLKTVLQDLHVKTIFGPDADLSAMLGSADKGVYVDNIYHSATIIIDELGGEAAAATGATAVSKGFSMPAPVCAVNRPFIFAIVHTASGAPLFVGKVADPTQH